MSSFITTLGYKEYSVSCSASEQRADIDGTRMYYHAKDLQCNRQHDRLTTNHIIKMTDVDYYVNIKSYLTGHYVLMYTFVPTDVAGSTTNGTYRVINGNQIETHITGGGHYVHPVWDYETDHLVVDHWWGSSFYLIEQKSISDDRRIVFLNPIRNVYGPIAWLIPGYRCRYRRLTYDNIAYIKSTSVGSQPIVKHSFALTDSHTSATIEDKVLVAIQARLQHVAKPTMSDVERIIRIDDTKDAHVLAGILFNVMLHPILGQLVANHNHYPITRYESGDNGYLPLGPLVTEDGRPAMRKITAPFMLNAAHPMRSENSDRACIKGRITDVKNPVKSVPPSYFRWVDEFASMLVPDEIANTLCPEGYDYLYDQWNRPIQRTMLDKVKHVLYFEKPWAVKSFQKAEMYAKITYPRNISTLPTGHNARGGQFAYVFSKYILKDCHWYAFGKHPSTISHNLHDKVRRSTKVIPTDLTKLDGSCGFFHTHIVKTCAIRAFAIPYKNELSRLMDREAHARGFTNHGICYEAEDNTLSGSSWTSARNSLANAACVYIALRQSGLDPKQAYAALGIYGGDDGITCDIDENLLTKVFAKTGLVLKAEVLHQGNPVPFLGRYFIDPWTLPDSVADVPRQLRKLHMTATPDSVPTPVVLRRRAEAILVTDSNTPVLSNWARAILRIVAPNERDKIRYEHYLKRDLNYWSKFNDPFPPTQDLELAQKVVDELFGNNLHVIALTMRLDDATTLNDIQYLVDDTPPKVEIPAIMHGVVLTPKNIANHQATLRKNQKIKVKSANIPLKPTTSNVAMAKPVINLPKPVTFTPKNVTNNQTILNKKVHFETNISKTSAGKNKQPTTSTNKTVNTGTNPGPTKPTANRAKDVARCRYAEKNQRCPRPSCLYQH